MTGIIPNSAADIYSLGLGIGMLLGFFIGIWVYQMSDWFKNKKGG